MNTLVMGFLIGACFGIKICNFLFIKELLYRSKTRTRMCVDNYSFEVKFRNK